MHATPMIHISTIILDYMDTGFSIGFNLETHCFYDTDQCNRWGTSLYLYFSGEAGLTYGMYALSG